MPIYEYICQGCRKKSSFFVRNINAPFEAPTCSSCGGRDMQRAISTFSYQKSLQTRWEEAGPPPGPNADIQRQREFYKDPANIGRWVEQRAKELGLELPQKVHDMIAEARSGELPHPLPGLGDFPDPLRELRTKD